MHSRSLRVEVHVPALVHWSADGWNTTHDDETSDTGLGIHVADLKTAELEPGTMIVFTFYWPEAARWEGTDFAIDVTAADQDFLE